MRVLVFGPPGQKDEVFLMSESANDDSCPKRAPPELSEQGGVTGTVRILGPPGGGDQGGDLRHLLTYLGLKTGTKEQARATSHTKHDKQKHKSQDIHSN